MFRFTSNRKNIDNNINYYLKILKLKKYALILGKNENRGQGTNYNFFFMPKI